MDRETPNRAEQWRSCTNIGKNPKPVIAASKWQSLKNCSEPNDEIQLDFGWPITSEKDHDIRFLACIGRFCG